MEQPLHIMLPYLGPSSCYPGVLFHMAWIQNEVLTVEKDSPMLDISTISQECRIWVGNVRGER